MAYNRRRVSAFSKKCGSSCGRGGGQASFLVIHRHTGERVSSLGYASIFCFSACFFFFLGLFVSSPIAIAIAIAIRSKFSLSLPQFAISCVPSQKERNTENRISLSNHVSPALHRTLTLCRYSPFSSSFFFSFPCFVYAFPPPWKLIMLLKLLNPYLCS